QDIIRSDVQVFAGGITWLDVEYEERLGEALRPMTIDSRGIPLGMGMRDDVKAMIAEASFLNRVSFPPIGRAMTASEIYEGMQEYIRNALPLFKPAEVDYNGGLCEDTFDLLMRAGGFGSPDDIPESIRGADIRFKFQNPLYESIERKKGNAFQEAKAMLAEA